VKVLIAPDSFKGSISNFECAEALADGWHSVRPEDQITLRTMADGGEGTLETIALQHPDAQRFSTKVGGASCWLLLNDGTAIVELANICGITLEPILDPLHASTYRLGLVLKDVVEDSRVKKVLIAVGGSASTDGGVGALLALGGLFTRDNGESVSLGGLGLSEITALNLTQILPAPSGGVVCLTDVNIFLLGELGSARLFAPQKGASEAQVLQLEAGLIHLQKISKRSDFPGAGAAGGTPFGLSLAWDIEIRSGAESVAEAVNLLEAIRESDLVITGEGKLDSQSEFGKVVGKVTDMSVKLGKKIRYCVGSSERQLGEIGISLVDLAPTLEAALNQPREWLVRAGAELARREAG